MSIVQHEGAQKLIKVIRDARSKHNDITYADAAELIKRPRSHARAVAQMCDLLDAAACLVGLPSIALVSVLHGSGQINPSAWKTDKKLREGIIERATKTPFSDANFQVLSDSLSRLKGKGNKRAWAYVYTIFPGEIRIRRLLGWKTDSAGDAINDIGSDRPTQGTNLVTIYQRDNKVRAAVLKRARGKCEYCNRLGFLKDDGTRYLETHHVIALANEGPDRVTNVLALCANDHREAHFGKTKIKIEAEMIVKLKSLNI